MPIGRSRPAEQLDNGRLSGTSAGERLDGDPHGAQRPYVDPLARTPGVGSDGFMNMSPLVQANDDPRRGDWLLRRVNIQWTRQPDIRCISSKLESAGQLLASFVSFAEMADANTVTTELALRWATQPSERSSI